MTPTVKTAQVTADANHPINAKQIGVMREVTKTMESGKVNTLMTSKILSLRGFTEDR
jgi:hypothetical protein